jgi:FkbM family methyltransferase
MQPWVIKARSMARRAGVIGPINRFRPVESYEIRVREALTEEVRRGDVVWDVGAHVGVYTELFCNIVGPDGRVVAFEPLAVSCDRIRAKMLDCPWLSVENVGLGNTDMIGHLVTRARSVETYVETQSDALEGDTNGVPVPICRGDTVGSRLGVVPNVVKVDAEGFEEEVLEGMERC